MDPGLTRRQEHSSGLPAHAGMDHRPGVRGLPHRGLPRTRGDGPRRRLRTIPATAGSPAHAGMDPNDRGEVGILLRLPRTRGDGPWSACARKTYAKAPPHTRGWTRTSAANAGNMSRLPAHAGMDPSASGWSRRCGGLPRTRGDGPASGLAGGQQAGAPPHTRGWTLVDYKGRGVRAGSPAHAGMDPKPATHGRSRSRLPRTRGDGPSVHDPRLLALAAPRHTRGWTRYGRRVRRRHAGSPAHAGMDPSVPGRCAGSPRLPRTRGDGPDVSGQDLGAIQAPPHTRGWTLHRGRRIDGPPGSPAHAGMDPWATSRGRFPSRLPAHAGMDPRVEDDGREPRGSPHTRGWT